jgi:maleylacetoacetate isomerase
MIKLFGYWRSTAAYRVRLSLNLKQISYSQQSVNLVKDGGEQHAAAYRELNPQGLVPTLVDGNIEIGQSMAILEYLEERYPQAPLLPSDKALRAVVRQLANTIACDLHPLNNLRVLQYLSNQLAVADVDKTKWYHHWLFLGFSAFEQLLQKHQFSGPYCIGGELTIADACLIPQIYNANRFGYPMDKHPLLQSINENCLKLTRVQDAIPENQPDAV